MGYGTNSLKEHMHLKFRVEWSTDAGLTRKNMVITSTTTLFSIQNLSIKYIPLTLG